MNGIYFIKTLLSLSNKTLKHRKAGINLKPLLLFIWVFLSAVFYSLVVTAGIDLQNSFTTEEFIKKVDWEVDFKTTALKQTTDRASTNVFNFRLQNEVQFYLLDNLDFYSKFGFSFGKGSTQVVYYGLRLKNSVYLTQAYFTYKVFENKNWNLKFNLGSLDMRQLKCASDTYCMGIMLGADGFIGVGQSAAYKNDRFSFGLGAQQTIPTVETLNDDTLNKEKTPSFLTETAEASLRIYKENYFRGFARHFRYKNLPSVSAVESRLRGNTTTTVPGGEGFQFSFDSFVYGGELELNLFDDWQFVISSFEGRNNEALNTFNQARMSFFQIGYENEDFRNIIRYIDFYTESDISPAIYNRSSYGFNNQEGFELKTKFWFKKLRFAVSARYISSEQINPTIFGDDQETFLIELETHDAKLF